MKIEESSDGTVRVVELDPTKWYWIILDADSGINAHGIRRVDGLILIKRPGTEIVFVENPNRSEVPREEDIPARVTERDDGRSTQ